MTSLTGRRALVTGASRGIGRSIAQRLGAEGATVAVHYGRSEQAAREVVQAIQAAGGAAFTVRADLDTAEGAQALWGAYDDAAAQQGLDTAVDILVNNAGVTLRGGIGEISLEDFERQFSINTRAPYLITQEGLKRLSDGGRIINISSGVTRIAFPDILSYAMTKGAIDAMTLTLAAHLGPRGITVNAVAPGIVDTDINASWLRGNDQAYRAAEQMSALGRVSQPQDIAGVVTFLAGDGARAVTGQVIDATAGSHL
ncbi:SDR family oxidoreductase [Kineococcus arenarius]|uniref:SDR family oxidoreductase n=1 Tax=unclassified Kineococcus TaxID=2621656 RepID=UPI003D7C4CF3